MSPKLWRTKSGVVVREDGRALEKYRGGCLRTKVEAYRADTGGFHGWLWLHLLESVSAAEWKREAAR